MGNGKLIFLLAKNVRDICLSLAGNLPCDNTFDPTTNYSHLMYKGKGMGRGREQSVHPDNGCFQLFQLQSLRAKTIRPYE